MKINHNIDLDDYLDTTFLGDVVLTSKYIVFKSKSDCDGDLLTIICLNPEGTRLLKRFKLNGVLEQEKLWLDKYYDSEFEANLKLDLERKNLVYTLYKIKTKYDMKQIQTDSFPHYLQNSAVAKNQIGSATIQLWLIADIFAWYQAYCRDNNNAYVVNGKKIADLTHRVSEHDVELVSFIYKSLVQNYVIEGIKHVEGGSAGFQMFFLSNITDDKYRDKVTEKLVNEFGLSPLLVTKFLSIIKFAIENDNALLAMQQFISRYNKGTKPGDTTYLDTWSKYINKNTFFGQLIDVLFNIDEDIKRATEERKQRRLESLENKSEDFSL